MTLDFLRSGLHWFQVYFCDIVSCSKSLELNIKEPTFNYQLLLNATVIFVKS